MLAPVVPVLVLASLALALVPAGASAANDPGRVLVRFRDGVDAKTRAEIAQHVGLELGDALPLVPELYELRVPTGTRVGQALTVLARTTDDVVKDNVVYAQPDDFVSDDALTTPEDGAYWPNDPYFWPAKYPNRNGCPDSARLGQWPLWPLGKNLSDKQAPANEHNPLPPAQQSSRSGGEAKFGQYDSVDVLPVWNALRDAHDGVHRIGKGRTGAEGRGFWTAGDIHRAGIAISDTGISDNPDVASQVAAIFSDVTLLPRHGQNRVRREFLREVYRDDPTRPDIPALNRSSNGRLAHVQDAHRPLFALDDGDTLDPGVWNPTNSFGSPTLPKGCDGHGTGVASVAAATMNNHQGLAGVAVDAPLVGLRPGMPWDTPQTDLASDDHVPDAMAAWKREWRDPANRSLEDKIKSLAIIAALRVPVFNGSFGKEMFESGVDSEGRPVPILREPALSEAYLRLFSTGDTLGVVAAGNANDRYGSGPQAKGAFLFGDQAPDAVKQPCGLRLLRTVRFRIQMGRAQKRWKPDVNWDKLKFLCVASTTSNGSRLDKSSGYGTAAVDIAAPGASITTASRPRATSGGGVERDVYANATGTSFASPMVAGAAALLREAAPEAPMAEIATALRRGARPEPALVGKVGYGQLDVACSLDWLAREAKRRTEDWKVVNTLTAPDFITATRTCTRTRPLAIEATLRVPKSELYAATRRKASFADLLAAEHLDDGEGSNSLAWQRALLLARGVEGDQGRVIFRIGTPRVERPVGGGAVYDAGRLVLACTNENFQLSHLSVTFGGIVKPLGWYYPTDTAGPFKGVELGVAIDKPWYSGLMPQTVTVTARGTCSYRPPG